MVSENLRDIFGHKHTSYHYTNTHFPSVDFSLSFLSFFVAIFERHQSDPNPTGMTYHHGLTIPSNHMVPWFPNTFVMEEKNRRNRRIGTQPRR